MAITGTVIGPTRVMGVAGATKKEPSEGAPEPHAETDVRFWHKADTLNALTNVRFWGQSGHDSNGSFMSAIDP